MIPVLGKKTNKKTVTGTVYVENVPCGQNHKLISYNRKLNDFGPVVDDS